MLDSVTKKRIDDLRNILVGKIPSPQSQVEQITTGLIYKFMYDMDNEAVEMGGIPSFFVDEFEKYSWKHLFNPKLGGVDRVKLYSDAIENLYNNPNAPSIFREIFKNSFLPFKDPSTLNMFLKEINEFHYSNSEQLGDAYEYLLSFMGSQGDAGQFRTPRHIIDFIIEIVNPQKNETILDPACGTSGFLISSFKHILNQNTQIRTGDQLNASERKQIGENLVGYDIDPAMSRISLVNMYLHNFAIPNISEYDTLSSENKWNEYFDVILANPPFFSPTGGIKPHSKFGVKSTRAEVLFVDYIMEHLKPNGRAGIIVPEGIIFQTGQAYKTLRKKLIEDYLVGVISLPSGVFQPYSGVKTSILILDKALNQKLNSIFFANVKNDGFTLGAQRTPISKNDLPRLISSIKSNDQDILFRVSKKIILVNKSCSLSQSQYQKIDTLDSYYPMKRIGELFTTSSGGTPIAKEEKYYKNGTIPWIRSGEIDGKIVMESEIKITELGLKESSAKLFPLNSILIAMYGATAGKVGILGIEAATNQAVCALFPNSECLPKYIYYLLRSREKQLVDLSVGGAQPNISQTIIKDFKIPLPSVEIQKRIIQELEGYQKIIDGCKQIISNYKPIIEIDPSWEMVELSELVSFSQLGLVKASKEQSKLQNNKYKYPYFKMNNITYGGDENFNKIVFVEASNEEVSKYSLINGDFLFNTRNTPDLVGKCCVMANPRRDMLFNNNILRLRFTEQVRPEFICLIFNTSYFKKELLRFVNATTSVAAIYQKNLFSIKIPLPNKDDQNKIVEAVLLEKSLLKGNKKLIEIYTIKIQDKLNKVWGR